MRKFTGDRLLIATHNKGKLEEIRALFSEFPFEIISAADMSLPEPVEAETTFVGNARIKAHAAAKATGLPTLADDSGLCIAALNGAPGVYTADWAEGPGGRDFARAMARVNDELRAVAAPCPRLAHFNSTLVLAWPDGHDEVFEGQIEGQIIWPPRGADGHGYDPIFTPEGESRTFAELSAEEKNRISHRARAFAQLKTCFM